MPPDAPGASLGPVLSALVLVVAVFLGRRLWKERRGRGDDLTSADARHFSRQDLRRSLGIVVLAAIAVGLTLGTRLDPARDRASARLFARTWIGISGLVAALLVLALFDWSATHAYARRHRKDLTRRHLDGLEAELRRRSAPRDGHAGPSNGPPPP